MIDPDSFFLNVAQLARGQGRCLRRQVGAVIVRDQSIIATGFNGTPVGFRNCTEGGCDRCFNSKLYPEGRDYDLCVCVHGEQNCILQAARFGISIQNTTLYTTLKPCLTCLKDILNSGISGVVYRDEWIVPLEQKGAYDKMASMLTMFRKYEHPVYKE